MNGAVLFVDDEQNILTALRRSMTDWLQEQEYGIETATSVDEALELIEKEPIKYHVVVSDMRMPKRSGAELLLEIQKRWPDVATVLATGFSEIDSIRQAIGAGIVSFLSKPWDNELLKAELHRALELSQLRRSNKKYMQTLIEETVWTRKIHQAILFGDSDKASKASLGVAYRPAQGWIEGGGDFFQILESSSDGLTIALGTIDVLGAEGTFFGLRLREMLAELPQDSLRKQGGLSAALETLNEKILKSHIELPGCFMDLLFCRLDFRSGRMTTASAGGESFFLVHGTELSEHHLPSPGLGYKPNVVFREQALTIDSKTRVVLVSRPMAAMLPIRKDLEAWLTNPPLPHGSCGDWSSRLLADVVKSHTLAFDATAVVFERPN